MGNFIYNKCIITSNDNLKTKDFLKELKKVIDPISLCIYDDIEEDDEPVLIELDFNCKELPELMFKQYCNDGFDISGTYRDEGTNHFTLFKCENGKLETLSF